MADRAEEIKVRHHANFVAIGQTVAEIWRFIFFNIAAVHHLGYCVRVWTTRDEHLVVFIVMQNLAEIDAVVSIICIFKHFANLA